MPLKTSLRIQELERKQREEEEASKRRARELAVQLATGSQNGSNSNSTNSSTTSQKSSYGSQTGSQTTPAEKALFKMSGRRYTDLNNATARSSSTGNTNKTRTLDRTNERAYNRYDTEALEKTNIRKNYVKERDQFRKEHPVGRWLGAEGNNAIWGLDAELAKGIDFFAPDVLTPKFAQDWINRYKEEGEKAQKKVEEERAGSWERTLAGTVGGESIKNIPSATMAYLSGGLSTVPQVAGKAVPTLLNANELAQTGSVFTRALNQVAKETGGNPMFWETFARTIGTTYEKELQNGADPIRATMSAYTNALLNAQIEVGGGIEVYDPSEDFLKALARSAKEEGLEEVQQYAVENLVNKAMGSNGYVDSNGEFHETPWFSLTRGQDAVINPVDMAEQGFYGAVTGGLLSGGRTALANTRASIMDTLANPVSQEAVQEGMADQRGLVNRGLVQDRGEEVSTKAKSIAQELQAQLDKGEELQPNQVKRLIREINKESRTNEQSLERARIKEVGKSLDEGTFVEETGLNLEQEISKQKDSALESRSREKARAILGENATDNEISSIAKVAIGTANSRDIDTVLTKPSLKNAVAEIVNEGADANSKIQIPINNAEARTVLENLTAVKSIANRNAILKETQEENAEDIKALLTNLNSGAKDLFANHLAEGRQAIGDVYQNRFYRLFSEGTKENADFEDAYQRLITPLGADVEAIFTPDFARQIFAQGKASLATDNAKATAKSLADKYANRTSGLTFENNDESLISESDKRGLEVLAKAGDVEIRIMKSLTATDKEGKALLTKDGKKLVANGMYHDGIIYISADTKNKLITVAKHELTHYIKEMSPDRYQELENFVLKKWYKNDPTAFAKRVEEYQRLYKDATPEEAREEIIADASEAFFTDEATIQEAVTFSEKLGKAIHDGIKHILDAFTGDDRTYRGYGDFMKKLGILQEAERMWLEALEDTQQRKRNAKGGTQTEATIESEEKHSLTDEDFVVKDGKARWTDKRIRRLMDQEGGMGNYSSAYAVLMNPRDYLKLTLSDEMLDKWNKGANTPEHPETRSLDREKLEKEGQTPYLRIYSKDGTMIQGHEGRHRMRALMEAGVKSVPVVLVDTDTKYSKAPIDSMTLSSQNFGYDPVNNNAKVTIKDLVPIRGDNFEELQEKFGGEADVKFSVSAEDDQTYLDAVNRGDMDTAQRMVDEEAKKHGYNIETFHGTKARFNRFRKNSHFGSKVYQALDRLGFYNDILDEYEDDPEVQELLSRAEQSGAKVMRLYIKANNPLEVSDFGDWDFDYLSRYLPEYLPDSNIDWSSLKNVNDVISALKDEGYDSMVYENYREGRDEDEGDNDAYILFDPTQAKLADPVTYDDDGNVIPLSERFNESNEDIRYSVSASNEKLANRDDTAVFIKNTKSANYISMILHGVKTEETRASRTLDKFIGKQVMITDGKKVYGTVVFGEPHKYTAEEFHSKEAQRKHRVPVGDEYDIKDGGTKWAYPIESYERFGQPRTLSSDKNYLGSRQARQVKYQDTDGNNLSENQAQDSEGNQMTKAQESFFKDSKIRDAKGRLKVMYHGTQNEFNVFNFSQGGKNGTALGFGIYLSPNRSVSESYGDRVIESYVNVTTPAYSNRLTIKTSNLKKLIRATVEYEVDRMIADGDIEASEKKSALRDTWISNYTYTHDKSLDASINDVVNTIMSLNDNDMDVVQEVMAGMAIRDYDDAVKFYDILTETTGIDGFVSKAWTETRHNESNWSDEDVVLAFRSNQIKNTNNTNPTDNDDIRYSVSLMENPAPKPFMKKDGNDITVGERLFRDVNGNPLLATGFDITADTLKMMGKESEIPTVGRFLKRMAKFMKKMGETYTFIGLDDVNNATLEMRYDKDGNPVSIVVSAMVKNGEYPINFDFSSICKKRQAVSKLFEELSKGENGENFLDSVELTQENLFEINKILSENGYETACLGCFVETKRYNIEDWADGFVEKWNNAVKAINPDAKYFDFASSKDIDYGYVSDEIDKFAENKQSEKEKESKRRKRERDNWKRKWLKNNPSGTEAEAEKAFKDWWKKEYNKKTTDYKESWFENPTLSNDKQIVALVNSSKKMQGLLRKTDLISPKGLKALMALHPDFYGVLYGHYGSGTPKPMVSFTPYNSELALLDRKMDSKGVMKEYTKKQNDKLVNDLVEIGGVRVQSFSDFLIQNVFDYIQMVADMSARDFPAHAYTKEIAFARIFGLTGMKINLSVMFDVDPDGIAYGLDKDGNYVVADRARQEREKKKGNHVFQFSIPYDEAVKLQNQKGYDGNVGIIGVGLSDLHIRKMLNDVNIKMIIPYHASGMPAVIKQLTRLGVDADYTSTQNTLDITKIERDGEDITKQFGKEYMLNLYKEKGSWKEAFKQFRKDTEGCTITTKKAFDSVGNFPLYTGDSTVSLDVTKDPKKTAEYYMGWCIENGHFPLFYQFADEENYYKVLYDFNVYHNDGTYAPQQAVTNTYPSDLAKIISHYMNKANNFEQTQAPKWDKTIEETKEMLKANSYTDEAKASLTEVEDSDVSRLKKENATLKEAVWKRNEQISAERMMAEIDVQKAKREANESKRKAVNRTRERYEERIEDLKQRQREKEQRAKERREAQEQREKEHRKQVHERARVRRAESEAKQKAERQAKREEQRAKKQDSKARTRLLEVARRLSKIKSTDEFYKIRDQLIGNLDLEAKSMTGRTRMKLEDLEVWYQDQVENNDWFVRNEALEKKFERLRKTHISDMSLEDVQNLTEILLMLEHKVRNDKKLINSQYKKDVFMASFETSEGIKQSKGLKFKGLHKLDNVFVGQVLSPIRYMRRITGYDEDNPLMIATRELEEGQIKSLDYRMNALKPFNRFTDPKFTAYLNGNKAPEIEVNATTIDMKPTTVKIVPAIRIWFYLSSMNADNMKHIVNGGVRMPNIELLKKGNRSEAYDEGTLVRFSKSQVQAIIDGMTQEEKAYANEVYRYFNEVAPEATNDVSEMLDGISIARVKNYVPIHVDKTFLDVEADTIKRDGTLEGMGSHKERVHSPKPAYAEDISDVLMRAIEADSKYVGMAIPIRNFNKIYRSSSMESARGQAEHLELTGKTDNAPSNLVYGDEQTATYRTRTGGYVSVQDAITKKWTSDALGYIDDFLSDLQFPQSKVGAVEKTLRSLTSNYAGAVLTLNASVALKQSASFPTAGAVLGWKPLIKSFGKVGKLDLEYADSITPLLNYRAEGFNFREAGDIQNRSGRDNWFKRIMRTPALNWIQGMDLLTTRKLFKASEIYVQDKYKLKRGQVGYDEKVAEIFNRVITETQPNYTVMERAGHLRSDSTLERTLSMFKTQPYQNFNIWYDAVGNYLAKKGAYKKSQTTRNREAFKEASVNLGRATTSQIAQLAVFAMMTSLWALARGKDDKWRDEEGNLSFASYLKQLAHDMLGGVASEFFLGSDVFSALDSVINDTYYSGFSSVTDSSINDFFNTGMDMMKLLQTAWSSFMGDSDEEVDVEKIKKQMEKVVTEGGRFSGIPTGNIINLKNLMYRWVSIAKDGEYIGEYEAMKMSFAKDTYKKELLFKAYRQDKRAFNELRKMMIDDGFKEDTLDDYIKKQTKENKTDSEQREYDSSMQTLEKSSIWENASTDDQDYYEGIIENLSVGIETKQTGYVTDKATNGLTNEQVILYKLALKQADARNNSNGSYDKDEKAEALQMLMREFNLTKAQQDAIQGK